MERRSEKEKERRTEKEREREEGGMAGCVC